MPNAAVSVQVKGAEDFARLVAAIKESGDKGLKSELYRALNRATKPLKPLVQQSARQRLPQRGGLSEIIANSRFSTRRLARGDKVGISFRGSSRHDIEALDRGRLRWPVFPRTTQSRRQWTWRERRIRPGWWSEPLQSDVPRKAQREIVHATETVKDKLERAAR